MKEILAADKRRWTQITGDKWWMTDVGCREQACLFRGIFGRLPGKIRVNLRKSAAKNRG